MLCWTTIYVQIVSTCHSRITERAGKRGHVYLSLAGVDLRATHLIDYRSIQISRICRCVGIRFELISVQIQEKRLV
jgi:hypothetical protein